MDDPMPRPPASRPLRLVWLVAGLGLVALGVIGAFLPLMPTTIFLILAAGCFARSSPRLEAKLLDHPKFGPSLRAWRAEGAISCKGKFWACAGMALGMILFVFGAHPEIWVSVLVGAILLGCAAWVLTRPVPSTL